MANKIILKNYYKERKVKQGTPTIGESMTNQSQTAETDIYACLNKYGITSLVNQTKAKEFLYLDNTNANMTLDEAVRMRSQLNEYFSQQPARVRKVFGDNVDVFIEKYKAKQFDEFLQTGVLNDELVTELTQAPTVTEKKNLQVNENLELNQGVTNNEQV